LLETKRVEIYYSLSGREYVTPAQLESDIEDEILRAGGRVNIVDLQAGARSIHHVVAVRESVS